MLAVCPEKGNFVAWLWRVEFGAVGLCMCAVIVRVLLREAGALLRGCAAEDWLLLAGALATTGRVAMAPWSGQVQKGWIWMFAVVCATHLAVKGFRATRVRS